MDQVDQVVAAVLRDGDRVLLCHRCPERAWYPNVWDLPGGHVEVGESATGALVRELGEELGIEVGEPPGPPFAVISTAEFDLRIWLIDSWNGTVRNAAPDEHDDLAWVRRADLDALVLAEPDYLALLTKALAATD
jgi:8-oxo-dGTP diphosphatase